MAESWRARALAAESVLLRLEWSREAPVRGWMCPLCCRVRAVGHAANCALGAVLKRDTPAAKVKRRRAICASDALHPGGHCQCHGEGRCDWCQAHRDIPEGT